jgi:predicted nucleic-acid-binding protein
LRLLDTNVILRWLLDDDEIQSRAADKFIQRAFREKQKLLLSDLTVAELVWVMEGKGMIPEAVTHLLRAALEDHRLEFENRERLLAALAWYSAHEVDFIDAYQAALAQEKKLEAVVSFDRDFSRLPVRWEIPEK